MLESGTTLSDSRDSVPLQSQVFIFLNTHIYEELGHLTIPGCTLQGRQQRMGSVCFTVSFPSVFPGIIHLYSLQSLNHVILLEFLIPHQSHL